MFEKFTDRARTIMQYAEDEAARLGHDSVDTVHVLLGMVRDGKGVAGAILAFFGVTSDAIRRAHDSVRDQSDATLAELEAQSLVEAAFLDHNYVGTESLLLAVSALSDSRAGRVLGILGFHPVQFCEEVLGLLGHADDWERWLDEHREAI